MTIHLFIYVEHDDQLCWATCVWMNIAKNNNKTFFKTWFPYDNVQSIILTTWQFLLDLSIIVFYTLYVQIFLKLVSLFNIVLWEYSKPIRRKETLFTDSKGTECLTLGGKWPNFHAPVDVGEQLSNEYDKSYSCLFSKSEFSPQNQSYLNASLYWVGTDLIACPKIYFPVRIESA